MHVREREWAQTTPLQPGKMIRKIVAIGWEVHAQVQLDTGGRLTLVCCSLCRLLPVSSPFPSPARLSLSAAHGEDMIDSQMLLPAGLLEPLSR